MNKYDLSNIIQYEDIQIKQRPHPEVRGDEILGEQI